MNKKYARFEHVETDHTITWQTDPAFCKHLKTGLLLALKEAQLLSEDEFRALVEA